MFIVQNSTFDAKVMVEGIGYKPNLQFRRSREIFMSALKQPSSKSGNVLQNL